MKINNIDKVSVKKKTISKAKQLHERNNDEMMWLQRKTNCKIMVTCEIILKIINNLLY